MSSGDKMQDIGKSVLRHLPEGYGFFVLVYPPGTGGEANYVSNSSREDVINVMKEFLIKCGHKEDWIEHLK